MRRNGAKKPNREKMVLIDKSQMVFQKSLGQRWTVKFHGGKAETLRGKRLGKNNRHRLV